MHVKFRIIVFIFFCFLFSACKKDSTLFRVYGSITTINGGNEVHSKVLGKTNEGYVGLDYNHMKINPNSNEETASRINNMIKELDK